MFGREGGPRLSTDGGASAAWPVRASLERAGKEEDKGRKVEKADDVLILW